MTFKTINPITERIIQEFEENTFEEIDLALKKSKLAQKEWFSKLKEKRISIMQNMKKSFEENQTDLIETVHEQSWLVQDM